MDKYKMIITAVDKFSKPLKKLSSGLAAIGKLAAGVGKSLAKLAIGITATVGAVSLVVNKYAEMLDKIGKTSEKLGISPDFLQQMRFAAEQTGVKVEALDMGLQRFSRRVAEAAKGTGEAKQALSDLGIQLKNNDGSLRSTKSVLFDVADAIQKTKDENEKIRLSFKFFDSEGVALVNTLRDGAAGLREFFQEAENLGIIIDDITIDSASKFVDSINRIKKQIFALGSGIIGAFLPVLEKFGNSLSEKMSLLRGEDGTFKDFGVLLSVHVLSKLADLVRALGGWLDSLEEFFNTVKNEIILLGVAVLQVMESFGQDTFAQQTRLLNLMYQATGKAGTRFNELALIIEQFAQDIIVANQGSEDLNNTLEKVNKNLSLSSIRFKDFAEGFKDALNESKNKLENFEDLGKKVAKTLEDGLTEAFMNIADGLNSLKDTFTNIMNIILEHLIRIHIALPIAEGISGMFKADGGSVTGGRPYIVGERGPELFVPGRTGTIVANDQMGASGVVINQSISFSTGLVPTVKAEVQKMLPQIAEVTKAAVAESSMRGGSYRRALTGG